MIVNLRGASGAGKSTLVHRLLAEFPHEPIEAVLSNWKKPKIVAYKVDTSDFSLATYVIGSYKTQCGGCDSLSYKGAFEDIQELVEAGAEKGNVIFEGLTCSSVYGRFLKVSAKFPGEYVWCFLDTPEDVCYQRIMARNGGKEPKRDKNGIADYQRKYRGCMIQMVKLQELGEHTEMISSDDAGYAKLLELLKSKPSS